MTCAAQLLRSTPAAKRQESRAIAEFAGKRPSLPGDEAESRMEHPAFAKHLRELVAGVRFELTTFGLCDLTQLSLRVGLSSLYCLPRCYEAWFGITVFRTTEL